MHQLSADVESLDIGETRKPLDLAPLAELRRLRRLRIVAQRRGLADLLHANPGLRELSLWRLPVDRVLPAAALPDLRSLALTLGSLADSEWLAQIPTLRYLALRQVRVLSDLDPVARLPALQLPELRGAASHLPVDAIIPFTDHPTLEHPWVGLGSQRRDRDAWDLVRVAATARRHRIRRGVRAGPNPVIRPPVRPVAFGTGAESGPPRLESPLPLGDVTGNGVSTKITSLARGSWPLGGLRRERSARKGG